MIRVDHAGEYGAQQIYKGQLAVLGKDACAPLLKEMLEQEQVHLAAGEADSAFAFLACCWLCAWRGHGAAWEGSGDGLHGGSGRGDR